MRITTALPVTLAASLALSACATVPDDGSPSCPTVSRDWQAWINAMPGPNAQCTLHITGSVDMPTPGYTVELVGGPADRMQPPGLRFRMEVTPPDGPLCVNHALSGRCGFPGSAYEALTCKRMQPCKPNQTKP